MLVTSHNLTLSLAKLRGTRMYEDGMQLIWDAMAKRLTVIFRGRVFLLPDVFNSQKDGIMAGEAHCKTLGWIPGKA